MAKRRIYEIAKERGLSTQELADKLAAAGVEVKSNLSSVEETDVDRVLEPTKGEAEPPPAAAKAVRSRGAQARREDNGASAVQRPPRPGGRRLRGGDRSDSSRDYGRDRSRGDDRRSGSATCAEGGS